MEITYLDNAATTPLDPRVRDAMLTTLEVDFGNPSSRHPLGVRAREALEGARVRVAQATGAEPEGVVFTAGGTEANNLALFGTPRGPGHALIGPTEHSSVRQPAQVLAEAGWEIEALRLDASGNLDLEHLVAALRPDTRLVTCMLVNNEFGTVYPIARVAKLVRANAPQAWLHVDAVQGLGKVPVSIGELGCHSLSVSAHKIHGPKGSGALVLAKGSAPKPRLFGGGQENGVRSGTENVAGCVGLGVAASSAAEHVALHGDDRSLRELLREELSRVPGARLLDPGSERSPVICAVLLPGPQAEVWMHHLEARGVYSSVGAACQARRGGVPPALKALGLDDEEARRVLRISFSRLTTREDVLRAVAELERAERELGVIG